MNRIVLPGRALALAAIACVVAGGPVAAQTTVKEVTVEAPRAVTTKPDPTSPPGGAQVEVTTIKMRVSYADLDLTNLQGFKALQTRIKYAATGLCAQLDKLYPFDPDPNCLARTIVTASAQVDDAWVAAIKRTLP